MQVVNQQRKVDDIFLHGCQRCVVQQRAAAVRNRVADYAENARRSSLQEQRPQSCQLVPSRRVVIFRTRVARTWECSRYVFNSCARVGCPGADSLPARRAPNVRKEPNLGAKRRDICGFMRNQSQQDR